MGYMLYQDAGIMKQTPGVTFVAGSPNTMTFGATAKIDFSAMNPANFVIPSGFTLGIGSGGTGLTTYTGGDIIYSDADDSLAALGIGTEDYVLTVVDIGGGTLRPQWASIPSPGTQSLQQTYDASSPPTIKLDASGDLLVELDSGTAGDKFEILSSTGGTDNFALTATGANAMGWAANLTTVSVDASSTIGIVGASTIDLQAASNVTVDSSGGSIGIGTDANTGAINMGTAATQRTITIGNHTNATAVNLNAGTAGITLNDNVGQVKLNGAGTLNETNLVGVDLTPSGNVTLKAGGTGQYGDSTGYLGFTAGALTSSGLVSAAFTTSGNMSFDNQGNTALFTLGGDTATQKFRIENNSNQAVAEFYGDKSAKLFGNAIVDGDLTVNGDITYVNQHFSTADDCIDFNSAYTTNAARSFGIMGPILPDATTYTVASCTAPDTITCTGAAANINIGDIIAVKTPLNIGFYEVANVVGSVITIDTTPSEFGTKNAVVTETAAGTVVNAQFGGLRLKSDGSGVEFFYDDQVGLTWKSLALVTDITLQEAYDNSGSPAAIATAGGKNIQFGGTEALDVNIGASFDKNNASDMFTIGNGTNNLFAVTTTTANEKIVTGVPATLGVNMQLNVKDNDAAAFLLQDTTGNDIMNVDTSVGAPITTLFNGATNMALTLAGTGQVTIGGNVNANAGLDVTGADCTVSGQDFRLGLDNDTIYLSDGYTGTFDGTNTVFKGLQGDIENWLSDAGGAAEFQINDSTGAAVWWVDSDGNQTVPTGGSINKGDNVPENFGDSNEFSIQHTGAGATNMTNTTGKLTIDQNAVAQVAIQFGAGAGFNFEDSTGTAIVGVNEDGDVNIDGLFSWGTNDGDVIENLFADSRIDQYGNTWLLMTASGTVTANQFVYLTGNRICAGPPDLTSAAETPMGVCGDTGATDAPVWICTGGPYVKVTNPDGLALGEPFAGDTDGTACDPGDVSGGEWLKPLGIVEHSAGGFLWGPCYFNQYPMLTA